MIGEAFDGDCSGGLVFGDSRTTFVGVALTLNDRNGESATLVGERVTGGLLTGDSTGVDVLAGDRAIMESFRGESSDGKRDMRLLRRRVDRLFICDSSICSVVSVGWDPAGTSNSISGCISATMRALVASSLFGSIGQRELCRFLGTHLKLSSGNIEDRGLMLSLASAAAAASSSLTMETIPALFSLDACNSCGSQRTYLALQ